MTGFRSSPDILKAMLAKADEKLAAARADLDDAQALVDICRNYLKIV